MSAYEGIGVRLTPDRHEGPGPSAAGIAAVEHTRRVPAARAGPARATNP